MHQSLLTGGCGWTWAPAWFPSSCWMAEGEGRSNQTDIAHPHLVLLVLPSVGETGDDCGHPGSRGDLAGVDHDEELHQIVIDLTAAALHNVDVLTADALADLHAATRSDVTRQTALSATVFTHRGGQQINVPVSTNVCGECLRTQEEHCILEPADDSLGLNVQQMLTSAIRVTCVGCHARLTPVCQQRPSDVTTPRFQLTVPVSVGD